jgi:hypothetical protein
VGNVANKRAKAVSFNLDKPEEQLMWKHVSKRNFSGYVKRLIKAELERQLANKNVNGSSNGNTNR